MASNVQFLGGSAEKASTSNDFAAPSFEAPTMDTQAIGGMMDDEVPF